MINSHQASDPRSIQPSAAPATAGLHWATMTSGLQSSSPVCIPRPTRACAAASAVRTTHWLASGFSQLRNTRNTRNGLGAVLAGPVATASVSYLMPWCRRWSALPFSRLSRVSWFSSPGQLYDEGLGGAPAEPSPSPSTCWNSGFYSPAEAQRRRGGHSSKPLTQRVIPAFISASP